MLLFVVDSETRVQDVNAAQEVLSFCNVNNVGLVYTTPLRDGLITSAGNGNGNGNGQGRSESS